MNKNEMAVLYRYNRWAWERVLDRTSHAKPEQYTALAPVPHGSLCGTLVHALGAEVLWRQRWQGYSPTALLKEPDLPTFEGLQRRWEVETSALQAFVARLSDPNLSETIDYRTTKGTPMTDVLWHLLVHVVNHGTQHRAEAGMLLTSFGLSPGDLDLLTFIREAK